MDPGWYKPSPIWVSFIELKILGFTTTQHDWKPTWPLPNMSVFAHVFLSQLRGFVPEILVFQCDMSWPFIVEIHDFLSGYHFSKNNMTLIPKEVIHNFRRQREQLCLWHPRISMQNMWSIEKCWAILDGDCGEMIASCFGDYGTQFWSHTSHTQSGRVLGASHDLS